jgi:phosphoglucomutase
MNINDALNNQDISQEAFSNIEKWLKDQRYAEFVPEIEKSVEAGDWQGLENSFYARLAIGTGGIRGPIGSGPNRINNRTIGEAAQGLAQFIRDFGDDAVAGGVVVGYDARKFAKEFAQISAEVFAANGIKVYFFDGLRATPEISFAVRHLKATAGVMITASHNPRTDNGFKFYWTDGGQVVPPNDAKFMELVTNVTDISRLSFAQAVEQGLIHTIGAPIDQEYFEALKTLSLTDVRGAKIVFSPMHGSGSTNVLPLLKGQGFNVTVVPEQAEPDSAFPTAAGDLINPEFPEVMELAVRLGEHEKADLVIVSDPDADRVGVAAPGPAGKMRLFNGDEVGAMLTHFILSQRKAKGTLPPTGIVLETYVTTTLISDIAKSFDVAVTDDLLVGFKYIAEIIEMLEDPNDFIFAAEQSLGYLAGSFLRDKDAAIASLLLAELASVLKEKNQTLVDYLESLGKEYGFYVNKLHTLDMTGRSGSERLFKIMTGFRANPPTELAGKPIVKVIDRLPEESRAEDKYKVGKTGDQITFVLSDDDRTRITVRPSGTEPIIKFYMQHYAKSPDGLEDAVAKMAQAITTHSQKFV